MESLFQQAIDQNKSTQATTPAPAAPATPATSQGGDLVQSFQTAIDQQKPPASANQSPAAQDNSGVAKHGLLHRAWDWVNQPIFDNILPKDIKTADIMRAAAFEKLTGSAYIPGVNDFDTLAAQHLGESPTKHAIKTFIAGSAKDTADMASGLTSPLGIGTTLATAGTGSEAAPALQVAGKIIRPLVGTAFGLQGAYHAAHGTYGMVKEGATPENVAETAGGLGQAALGAGAGVESVGALKNTVKGLLDTKAIQPELQTGIRDILSNAADEAGVAKSAAPSIRKVSEETADAVYAKSKAQYDLLDDATGGRFQRFKDRLDNIRQKLNGLTGTEADTAEEAKLLQAQHETEQAMQEAFEDAKTKGVDPKLVDEANANFKKSQALYDLDSQIKKVVTGGRPGVSPANQLDKAQELIDPKKFLTRVNGLYDSGRLQDALGVKGADDLFNHAVENSIKNSQILRNQRAAKYAAAAAGLGALGHGAVSHVVHAVAPVVP